MDIGVFDHLDRGAVPLDEYYETRLKLMEAYDRHGVHAYYVAEHHSTPLGLAPAPSVFLSAIIQRTRRLRVGTMVYVTPLHHPLRIAEEICMLDQMSRGRLELGFGRGSVSMELNYYGVDAANSRGIHEEAHEVIRLALTQKIVDYRGRYFQFSDVPMELEPFQKPLPPLWYGVHSAESAEKAARAGMNIVCNEPSEVSRAYIDRFRAVWREAHGPEAPMPRIGITQSVLVGENDGAALKIARRAYLVWHRSFHYLWKRHGKTAPISGGENDFDALCARGKGVAGSAATVSAFIRRRLLDSGANYPIVRFGFGDLTLEESVRSVELFMGKVVPGLGDIDSGDRAGLPAAP